MTLVLLNAILSLSQVTAGATRHAMPPLGILREAALREAHLVWHGDEMEKRMRWRHLLPTVTVRGFKHALDSQTESLTTLSGGWREATGFEAGLVFNLSGLLFDNEEVNVSRDTERHERLKREIVRQLHADYFEYIQTRRELDVAFNGAPPATLEDRREALAANLDALTGGLFSRLLAEGGGQ